MKQELVDIIWAQWKATKACAEEECRQRNLDNLADKYMKCDMFKGNETIEQIASLYKSARGMEFCLTYHFPSIETLRMFKQDNPEQYGVYIDAGVVDISNPTDKVLLIGNTTGRVTCTETRRYQIAVLHGATAVINASGWAVVAPEVESGCSVIKNIKDNAIIL